MTTHQIEPSNETLPREISRLAFAALALNGMIGSGIFGLPADAARLSGAFSPAMFAICAALVATIMLSFAQAASHFDGTGGPIRYAGTAFGPFVGFQTGWLLYIGRATALAAGANVLTTYVATVVPGADEGVLRASIITVVCASFTALNVVGVRQGIRSVLAMTVVKLALLGLFIIAGLAVVRSDTFASAALPAYAPFGQTVLLLLYAFVGFEGAVVPAGEGRDPARDIPRAILMGAGVTAVVYVLVQVACVAILPDLASSKRPIADAAIAVVGPIGGLLVAVAAAVSIFGNIAASMVAAPRMTYALALDGSLPAPLGRVSARFGTPAWSIWLYGLVGWTLALTGSFVWLAGMSSLVRVIGYAVCIAALPRIRRSRGPGAFTLPGGWTIPALALAICAWLLTQANSAAFLTSLCFAAAGTALYVFASWGARRQRDLRA